jgi:hypothetical protein
LSPWQDKSSQLRAQEVRSGKRAQQSNANSKIMCAKYSSYFHVRQVVKLRRRPTPIWFMRYAPLRRPEAPRKPFPRLSNKQRPAHLHFPGHSSLPVTNNPTSPHNPSRPVWLGRCSTDSSQLSARPSAPGHPGHPPARCSSASSCPCCPLIPSLPRLVLR